MSEVNATRRRAQPQLPEWLGLEANVDHAPMASWGLDRQLPLGAPLPAQLPALSLSGAKTAKAAARRLGTARALCLGRGFAVRHSLVAPVCAPEWGLDLRRVRVAFEDQVLDEDWAILEPTTTWPMDRDASEATWACPSNPHGSFAKGLRVLRFGVGREPPAAAVRIGDLPSLVAYRAPVVLALQDACGPSLARHLDFASLFTRPLVSQGSSTPPLGPDPADAAQAASSFWSILGGTQASREVVCRSPHYATWLARLVDRAPGDDTRAAAMRHPDYAAAYAYFVDRGPRDDTRLAAAANSGGATFYAQHVDRALTPPVVATLKAAGWSNDDLLTLGLSS